MTKDMLSGHSTNEHLIEMFIIALFSEKLGHLT